MLARRIARLSSCLLLLSLFAHSGVLGAEASAEDVLKNRGLTKVGSVYVLADEESSVLKQLDAVAPYFAQLQEARATIMAINQADAEIQVAENRMSFLNARVGQLDDVVYHMGRKNSVYKQELIAERAALVDERAALGPQLNAAKNARPGPAKRQQLMDEFERRRIDFLDKVRYVHPAAEQLKARYDALAKDKAVGDALKALREAKARVGLGPSPTLKSRYRDFLVAVAGAKTYQELLKDQSKSQSSTGPAQGKRKTSRVR